MGLPNAGRRARQGPVDLRRSGPRSKCPMGELQQSPAARSAAKRTTTRSRPRLVQGVSPGLADLEGATARKALIVVGDGSDTDPDEREDRARRCSRSRRPSSTSSCSASLQAGAHRPSRRRSSTADPDGERRPRRDRHRRGDQRHPRRALAGSLLPRVPGLRSEARPGLTWDGKDHDLVVKIDQGRARCGRDRDVAEWDPPKHGGFPWWLLIVIPDRRPVVDRDRHSRSSARRNCRCRCRWRRDGAGTEAPKPAGR